VCEIRKKNLAVKNRCEEEAPDRHSAGWVSIPSQQFLETRFNIFILHKEKDNNDPLLFLFPSCFG
jgi:hypothetical protein